MTDPREDERRRRAAVERDAEAARAVAFLASKGEVEAGAVELLTRDVAAELATLCEEADRFESETLAPIDAACRARREPEAEALRAEHDAKAKAARGEPIDVQRELAERLHAEKLALLRAHDVPRAKAIGDLAPLDAALVRRLRELAGRARSEAEAARGERAKKAREADAEAADKAAAEVKAKAREAWARDVDKGLVYFTPWALAWPGPHSEGAGWGEKWNTVHESGLPVEPLGVSWPPDAQSARGALRLPQEGDPAWPLWCKAHKAAGVDHTLNVRAGTDGDAQRQRREEHSRFVEAFNAFRDLVLAKVGGKSQRQRWRPAENIVALARALWSAGGVREAWAREQRNRPAMVRAVAADVADVMNPRRQQPMPLDGRAEIVSAAGRGVVATVPGDLFGHVALFGTVWANRCVDLFVNMANEAWLGDEQRLYNQLTFDGGLGGLARAIGYKEPKHDKLIDFLALGHGLQLSSASGGTIKGLWTYEIPNKAAGAKARMGGNQYQLSKLVVTLAPVMLPKFHEQQGKGERQLLPVLTEAPPWAAAGVRPNEHGRVYAAGGRRLLLHMRDKADPATGAVKLPPSELRRIVHESGLDVKHADAVLDVWTQGDGDRRALVEVEGAGERRTVVLAEPHELARAFIQEGRAREEKARRAGRRSAAKRSAKR